MSRLIVMSVLVFFSAVGVYWGGARYTSLSLQEAFVKGDYEYVDRAFDWGSVSHKLGANVATSFQDSNAALLGRLVSDSFRSEYIKSIKSSPSQVVPKVVSEGFTNIDEYTLETSAGNRFILRRHGVKWIVEELIFSIDNVRMVGVRTLAQTQKNSVFTVSKGDIYFGEPVYGCRITNTGDVSALSVISNSGEVSVAYIRNVVSSSDKQFSQVWRLTFPSLASELLLDGSVADSAQQYPKLGSGLVSSADGGHLYFSAQAWVTSDAIIELETKSKITRIVSPGNGLYMLRSGKYAGSLVTSKHKYLDGGGSYDWIYIIDNAGKELANSGAEIGLFEFARAVESVE